MSPGESIAAVLKSTGKRPSQMSTTVDRFIRVSEHDECGANARAESILSSETESAGQQWHFLSSICMAHKIRITGGWQSQKATGFG